MIVKLNSEVDERVFIPYTESTRTLTKSPIIHFFYRLVQRISRSLVDDVPPELDACETCRELDCSQHRFEHCEKRIAICNLRKQTDR